MSVDNSFNNGPNCFNVEIKVGINFVNSGRCNRSHRREEVINNIAAEKFSEYSSSDQSGEKFWLGRTIIKLCMRIITSLCELICKVVDWVFRQHSAEGKMGSKKAQSSSGSPSRPASLASEAGSAGGAARGLNGCDTLSTREKSTPQPFELTFCSRAGGESGRVVDGGSCRSRSPEVNMQPKLDKALKLRLIKVVDDFFGRVSSPTDSDIWALLARLAPFAEENGVAYHAALEKIAEHLKSHYLLGKIDLERAIDLIDALLDDEMVEKKMAEGKLPRLAEWVEKLAAEAPEDGVSSEADFQVRCGMVNDMERFFQQRSFSSDQFQHLLNGLVSLADGSDRELQFAIDQLFEQLGKRHQKQPFTPIAAKAIFEALYSHPVIGRQLIDNRLLFRLSSPLAAVVDEGLESLRYREVDDQLEIFLGWLSGSGGVDLGLHRQFYHQLSTDPIFKLEVEDKIAALLRKFDEGGEYHTALTDQAINEKYQQLFDIYEEISTDDSALFTGDYPAEELDDALELFSSAPSMESLGDRELFFFDQIEEELDDALKLAEGSDGEPVESKRELVEYLALFLTNFDRDGVYHSALDDLSINDKYQRLFDRYEAAIREGHRSVGQCELENGVDCDGERLSVKEKPALSLDSELGAAQPSEQEKSIKGSVKKHYSAAKDLLGNLHQELKNRALHKKRGSLAALEKQINQKSDNELPYKRLGGWAEREIIRLTDLRAAYSSIKRKLEWCVEEKKKIARLLTQKREEMNGNVSESERTQLKRNIEDREQQLRELSEEIEKLSSTSREMAAERNLTSDESFLANINREIEAIKRGERRQSFSSSPEKEPWEITALQ